MTGWVSELIVAILTKLTSSLLAMLVAKIHATQDTLTSNNQIDARLQAFKDAYKEAFNGKPVTPEEQTKLKAAISDFIRGGTTGGL